MALDTTADSPSRAAAIRTFLIADIRGYTRFTYDQGDEAARELAATFASIARRGVGACDGEVIETRGDEVVAAFTSARQAVRAAVELQRRLRGQGDDGPALPLGVGIGLDAGEAVPLEGGYRGRALNGASRLCAVAKPGQILASETVSLLAGSQHGMHFDARRPARLKGFAEPVRHVEVVPEPALPPLPALRPARATPRMRWNRLVPLGILIAIGGLATGLAIALMGEHSAPTPGVVVSPNSVALIDPKTNRVVADILVGKNPGPITVGGGAAWVGNGDQTVSKIDLAARTQSRIGVGVSPESLAYADGTVWIGAMNGAGTRHILLPLDASTGLVGSPIASWRAGAGALSLSAGGAGLWVGFRNLRTIYRVDTRTQSIVQRVALPLPASRASVGGQSFAGTSALGVGGDAVWVAGWNLGALQSPVFRVDPKSGKIVKRIPLDTTLEFCALTVDSTAVWVADYDRTVWEIDPTFNSIAHTIATRPPLLALSIASGDGAIWVASGRPQPGSNRLTRLDPHQQRVVSIIHFARQPLAVAVANGLVWVTAD